MDKRLVEIATGDLLDKFGAGEHKPGSGSASAFQGMLACQLLKTVIQLTKEEKRRPQYDEHFPELNRIINGIDNRIYPELTNLFQTDAELFDQVITLRDLRNAEQDAQKKREIAEQATNALKLATQTPIDIAELCLEIGDFATFVFDNGFQSARGDTGVALNSAISGLAGCLSIVDLNLITLPFDDFSETIRAKKNNLKTALDRLWSVSTDRLKVLELESSTARQFNQKISEFRAGDLGHSLKTDQELEKMVQKLQNLLWTERKTIWKKNKINFPAEVLQPRVVLTKIMGYSYDDVEEIGSFILDREIITVAGLIDKQKKHVRISAMFPDETRNFTIAHELGHAILHKGITLHRDRPLDGSITASRTTEERQADKFASYFLLPENIVREVFVELFKTESFKITEESVLFMRGVSISVFRATAKSSRGLARILATTTYYAGESFNSMAKVFKVSAETMAIRLEELKLVEF